MRWIEGGDLAGEIARTGGLEPTRAQGLLTQVASGLDAVHAHGLVHGDLKPANMLIEPRGAGERAYLSDFGAGRSLEATASGNWLGTVDYVGPETIRGAPPDPRADRYALACVLFEALTAGRGHRGGGGLLAAAATSKSQDERSGADEQSGASRHEHERIVHRPERLRRTSSRSTARSSREITRQRDG
jgi:serine/threonine protein kinase